MLTGIEAGCIFLSRPEKKLVMVPDTSATSGRSIGENVRVALREDPRNVRTTQTESRFRKTVPHGPKQYRLIWSYRRLYVEVAMPFAALEQGTGFPRAVRPPTQVGLPECFGGGTIGWGLR
jgi:hypothetical protein